MVLIRNGWTVRARAYSDVKPSTQPAREEETDSTFKSGRAPVRIGSHRRSPRL